jgi:hypothetical protein
VVNQKYPKTFVTFVTFVRFVVKKSLLEWYTSDEPLDAERIIEATKAKPA